MKTRNKSVTQFNLASSLASTMKLGDTIIPRNREYVMVYDYFYRLQDPPVYWDPTSKCECDSQTSE